MRRAVWLPLILLLCLLCFGCKAEDTGGGKAEAREPRKYEFDDIEKIAPLNVYHFDESELIALCFHHVDETGATLSASPNQIGDLAVEFAKLGYTFVDANDIAKYKKGRGKPSKKMVLFSFDDGYADNYAAAQLLDEYGIKGTFFVITNQIGKKGYLSAEQIQDMDARGFAIGSHTASHLNLLENTSSVVNEEMKKSKDVLEELLGHPVVSVAYPGGYASDRIEQIAEKYYDIGFLAASDPRVKETNMSIKRWGVFSYNKTISSILNNDQSS